jgi:hypothetical protein
MATISFNLLKLFSSKAIPNTIGAFSNTFNPTSGIILKSDSIP